MCNYQLKENHDVGCNAETSAEKALLCISSTHMLIIPYSTPSSTPYTGKLKEKFLYTVCHNPIPLQTKEGRLGLLCTPDTSFYSPPLCETRNPLVRGCSAAEGRLTRDAAFGASATNTAGIRPQKKKS